MAGHKARLQLVFSTVEAAYAEYFTDGNLGEADTR
jgi:hypothetical protein